MSVWRRLLALVGAALRNLVTMRTSDEWPTAFATALASGLPLLVGAYFDRIDYGLVASLGGLVLLYLPSTPLYHRMVLVMACAFGMTACYTLGLMSHFSPPLMGPVLVFIAILVTMVCRFYDIGPPGSLFFIMAASIAAFSPVPLAQVPAMTGMFTMGCLVACLIGFFYSLYILRRHPPEAIAPLPTPTFDLVVFDAVVIGVFVGISLAAAQALDLQQAYWVPVSCLAVIEGASVHAIWRKQLQRVIGTAVGLLVSWGLLLLPLNKWSLPLAMMALTFVVRLTVARHYAFAVAFITALAILLAEAATLGQASMSALIQARFLDTMLGCVIGLIGGIFLHSPSFRRVVGGQLRRLTWKRLTQ